jgi:hypothetical protein
MNTLLPSLEIDLAASQLVQAALIRDGVHGLVLTGTVGEGNSLSAQDPVPLPEIQHLYDHRLDGKIENAEAIDEVLGWARDIALSRVDIVAQHAKMIDRSDRCDATNEHRSSDPLEGGVAIMDVHEWPAEHISEAADLGDDSGVSFVPGAGPGGKVAALFGVPARILPGFVFSVISLCLRLPNYGTRSLIPIRPETYQLVRHHRRDVYVAVLFDFTGWRIGRRGLPFLSSLFIETL